MSGMANTTNNIADKAKNTLNNTTKAMSNFANEIMADGNCYLIIVYLVCIIFLVIFSYSFYLRKELTKADNNLKLMKENHGERTQLEPLDNGDYYPTQTDYDNTYYALIDYHIMGSYNSCSSGPVINGHVSKEALGYVIGHGVRFLDFEIYLKNKEAVVAVGRNNIYIKDSLNELNLNDVLDFVKSKALEGSILNNTDPLILQFRIMSGNDAIYSLLAKSIKKYFSAYLLSANYGKGGDILEKSNNKKNKIYTGNGKTKFKNNVLFADLNQLKNKVVIIVKDHDDFIGQYKKNRELYELINIGNANNEKVIWQTDYEITNAHSHTSVKEESKYNYRITNPDAFNSKSNSKASTHMSLGTQAILMNFGSGFNDSEMEFYKKKFGEAKKAFILKDKSLRRIRIFANQAERPDINLDPTQSECKVDIGTGEDISLGVLPGGCNSGSN